MTSSALCKAPQVRFRVRRWRKREPLHPTHEISPSSSVATPNRASGGCDSNQVFFHCAPPVAANRSARGSAGTDGAKDITDKLLPQKLLWCGKSSLHC